LLEDLAPAIKACAPRVGEKAAAATRDWIGPPGPCHNRYGDQRTISGVRKTAIIALLRARTAL
jgi:hypothetical protein